jgi:hypothetical protein
MERNNCQLSTTQKYFNNFNIDYAQKVLDEQKEAFKKYGVNPKKITGVKSFKPIGIWQSNLVDAIKPPKEP